MIKIHNVNMTEVLNSKLLTIVQQLQYINLQKLIELNANLIQQQKDKSRNGN